MNTAQCSIGKYTIDLCMHGITHYFKILNRMTLAAKEKKINYGKLQLSYHGSPNLNFEMKFEC